MKTILRVRLSQLLFILFYYIIISWTTKRKGVQILVSLNTWTTQPWWWRGSVWAVCLTLCPPSKAVEETGGSHACIYCYDTIYPILKKKRGDSWKGVKQFTFCMGKCQDSDSLEGCCNSTQFCFPGKLLISLPCFPHQQTYSPSRHVNTFPLTLPSQDKTIQPLSFSIINRNCLNSTGNWWLSVQPPQWSCSRGIPARCCVLHPGSSHYTSA